MAKTFYIVDDHELLRIGTISFIEKNLTGFAKEMPAPLNRRFPTLRFCRAETYFQTL